MRERPLRHAIVGGTGNIGAHLARALRARGDEVQIVTRQAPKGADDVQWSIDRGILQPKFLDGVDVVINLAGAPIAARPWTTSRRRLLEHSRIDATAGIVASLSSLSSPPRIWIGASMLAIFGDRGDVVIDDDDPVGTGFWLADLCSRWEAANAAAGRLGCRVVTARFPVVLSATGGAFPQMLRPFRYVGGWLGNGRQYTPWVSMGDAVAAVLTLADNDALSGPINITVPDPQPNKEWLKALGRAVNRPVVTHAPKWALRGALGEFADDLFLASMRARPRKLLDVGFGFVDTDPEATFRALVAELGRG